MSWHTAHPGRTSSGTAASPETSSPATAGPTALYLAGDVLTPGADGYPEAAATAFAAGTPDLVVRPRDATGVAVALRYAAAHGLAVSVRSGGHSMAGLSTHTDGMVIDLRLINSVEIIDPASRRVRIGAGAIWGDVAAALQPHGLGLTAGDTRTVGVGGLTLGGGVGWLVRRHGLAIDSLLSADIVTADGHAIRAAPDQHPGLFWALRGGGGNFGVVTNLEFTAQPVSSVHFGTIVYQSDDLPRLIGGWRDVMRSGDEDLTTILSVLPALPGRPPVPGQPPTVVLQCCYAEPGNAAAALAPLRQIGQVVADDVRETPYAGILADGHRAPGRAEIRSTFIPDLDDRFIAAIAEAAQDGGVMLGLRSLGGAAGRVPPQATAFAHRDVEALLVAGFAMPASEPPGEASQVAERWSPLAARGRGAYLGFLSSATDADVAAAYPAATYESLAAIKRRYDPDNVFRRNHNIHPAHA